MESGASRMKVRKQRAPEARPGSQAVGQRSWYGIGQKEGWRRCGALSGRGKRVEGIGQPAGGTKRGNRARQGQQFLKGPLHTGPKGLRECREQLGCSSPAGLKYGSRRVRQWGIKVAKSDAGRRGLSYARDQRSLKGQQSTSEYGNQASRQPGRLAGRLCRSSVAA